MVTCALVILFAKSKADVERESVPKFVEWSWDREGESRRKWGGDSF